MDLFVPRPFYGSDGVPVKGDTPFVPFFSPLYVVSLMVLAMIDLSIKFHVLQETRKRERERDC